MTVTQARWLAVPSSQADPTWPWKVALFLSGVTRLTPTWSRWDAAASPRRGLSLDLADEP